jgi:hypothetical protein
LREALEPWSSAPISHREAVKTQQEILTELIRRADEARN